MFTAGLFTTAKIMETSVHHQMNGQGRCGLCTVEDHSVIKKSEILPFLTIWMDQEGDMLREISQKDKYYMISLISGI